jgi:hypothetical protein
MLSFRLVVGADVRSVLWAWQRYELVLREVYLIPWSDTLR